MHLASMSARCRACHALVDLRTVLPAAGDSTPAYDAPAADAALPVPLPARIRVLERGRDLRIVRRSFTWATLAMAFCCLLWNGFLVLWYMIAFATETPLAMKLAPLLHVAVGLGLAYATIAGFVNRTTIIVERDHLSVRHGPLPWRGNLDVSASVLQQLFCTEKVVASGNGASVHYGVDAVLRDGRHLRIASGLPDREQALFIEQRIEAHLGIQDRPVGSEMPR